MTKFVDPFADPAAQEDSTFVDPFAQDSKSSAGTQSAGLSDATPKQKTNPAHDKFAKEILANQQKEKPEEDEGSSGFFGDFARAFASGAVSGVEGDVKIADYVTGGTGVTEAAGNKLAEINEGLFSSMTPEAQEAMRQKFVVDDEDGISAGDAATNWRSWVLTGASGLGSLGTMVLTGGPLKFLFKKGLTKGLKKELEKHALKKYGKKKAQEITAKRLDDVAGVLGYGTAEAAMVSGSVGKGVEQSVMELPQDVLDSSAIYAETFNQLYDAMPDLPRARIQDLARKQVARQMGIEGAKDIALPSLLLGTIAGRYIDKALKGKLASTRLRAGGKAMAVEAPTEALQGASEQYVQNKQVGELDPSQDPMEDVYNAGVSEGVGGMFAGGMLGLATGAEKPVPEGEGPADDRPEDLQIDPTTGEPAAPEAPQAVDDSDVIPVQEAPETVAAQISAVSDGRKPSMLLTPGEQVPEDIPEHLAAFDLGQKVGYLIYPRDNPEVLAQARAEVQETGMVSGTTLGYGTEGKDPNAENVVTARDENGVVIQDVVDDGSQSVVDAAEQVAGEGGTVEERPIQESLDEREQAQPLTVDEQKEELRQKYRDGDISHQDFAEGVAALMQDPRKPAEEAPAEQENVDLNQAEGETATDEGQTDSGLSEKWAVYDENNDGEPFAFFAETDQSGAPGSLTRNEDGTYTAWADDGTNNLGTFQTTAEAGKAVEDYFAAGGTQDQGERPPNLTEKTAEGQPDNEGELSEQDGAGLTDDDFEAMIDEEMAEAGLADEKPETEPEPLTNEGIDDAAHKAATSPTNDIKEPTQAQKESENYKLGDVINLHGLRVRIENPRTSYRFKVDEEAIREIIKGRGDTPNTADYASANKIYDLLEQVLEKLSHNSTVPEAFKLLEQAHKEARNVPALQELMDNFMLPEENGDPKPYWYNEMKHHYGKILGTTGADGDHVDVFLGPDAANPDKTAFIIDQVDPSTGEFDEHKVMIGFDGRVAAANGYRSNYDKQWSGMHDTVSMSMEELVEWTKGDTTQPFSEDLKGRSAPQNTESDTQDDLSDEGGTQDDKAGVQGEPAPEQGEDRWIERDDNGDKIWFIDGGDFQSGDIAITEDRWGQFTLHDGDGEPLQTTYKSLEEAKKAGEEIADALVAEPETAEPDSAEDPDTTDPAKSETGNDSDIPLNEGDVFTTVTGRETAPFPRTNYKRESKNEENVREWLKSEAVAEAKSRDDDFNLLQFENLNTKNWSQADGDSVNLYLFDDPEGRIGNRKVTKPEPKPDGKLQGKKIGVNKLGFELRENEYKRWYVDADGNEQVRLLTTLDGKKAKMSGNFVRQQKKKAPDTGMIDRLENYFQEGRIVDSYAGQDRVIKFERTDTAGGWQVEVVEVDKNGNDAGSPRTHMTAPSEKNLAKWEQENPVGAKADDAEDEGTVIDEAFIEHHVMKKVGTKRSTRFKELTKTYSEYGADMLREFLKVLDLPHRQNGKNLSKQDAANALLDYFEQKPAKQEADKEQEKAKRRVFLSTLANLSGAVESNNELLDLARDAKTGNDIQGELMEFVAGWVERAGSTAEAQKDEFTLAAIDALVGDGAGPSGLDSTHFDDNYVQGQLEMLQAKNKRKDKAANRGDRVSLEEAGAAELERRLEGVTTDKSLDAGQYSDGWNHAMNGGTMSNLKDRGEQSVRVGYQDASEWMKNTKRTVKGKKQGSTGTALRRSMDGVKKLDGGTDQELQEIYKLTTRSEVMNRDELVDPDATPGVSRYFDWIRNDILPFKEWHGEDLGGRRTTRGWGRTYAQAIEDHYASDPADVVRSAEEYLKALEEFGSIFKGAKTVEQAANNYQQLMYGDNKIQGWLIDGSEAGSRLAKFQRRSEYGKYPWVAPVYKYIEGGPFTKNENEPYAPSGNRKKPLRRPRLDTIRREGFKDTRGNKNITPQQLKDAFGFTDITIGESVTARQEQDHLNYAYDSLMSLSETLGVDPKNLSLGGWLHFSIGALGHGKFAAHFQRAHPLDAGDPSKGTTPVINLTNTSGDGAVAHEWLHALDERLAQNSGTGQGGKSSLVDYVVDNLMYRPPSFEEATKDLKRFWEGSHYPHLNSAAGRGKEAPPIQHALFSLESSRAANKAYERRRTDFLKDATQLDNNKKDGYWARRKELFARAGEAYIYDAMKGIDDYLVSDWVGDGQVDKPAYKGRPYPADEERQFFKSLFAELFENIEWSDKGPTIKKSWQPNPDNGYDQEAFRQSLIKWVHQYQEQRDADKTQKAQDRKIGWKGGTDLARALFVALNNGSAPTDNNSLKKFVEEIDGKKPDANRLKEAQEDYEVALVQRAEALIDRTARSVSVSGVPDVDAARLVDEGAFNALLNLYNRQPLLNIQTTTSSRDQAYSTPAPLAYVATRLAGMRHGDERKSVYEPAAGNGMLLINATLDQTANGTVINEINPRRMSGLEKRVKKEGSNAHVTGYDATGEDSVPLRQVDFVMTNPPFGALETPVTIDGYKITKIDQLIAIRALGAMKDDGGATLILGANKAAGEISISDRVFFNWLYKNYNVTEHVEVSGDLYTRQGASWPVRMIVIDGRKQSNQVSPKAGTIQRISSYEELYDYYQQAQYGNVVPGVVESSGETAGDGDTVARGSNQDELPGSTGGSSADADRGNTGGSGQGGNRGSANTGNRGNAGGQGGVGSSDRQPAGGSDPAGGRDRSGDEGGRADSGNTGRSAGTDLGLSDNEFEAMIDEEIEASDPVEKPETKPDDRKAELVEGYGWMVPMRNASEQADAELVDGYGWMVPVSALETSKPKPGGRKNKKNSDKTAGDHLKDAAKSGGAAASDAWKGLNELFGGHGRLGSGLNFDEETYAKAKPLFQKAMQEAIESGKSLKEALRAVIQQALKAYGAVVKPYLMQFNKDINKDIADGKIDKNGNPIETAKSGQLQTKYTPASKSGGIDTLTPSNQAAAVRRALQKVEDEYGNIDDFVMNELQYESHDALFKALMGHQVDGVALAIYQLKHKKALIIGDQTGAGKGRQAAAILRWAKLNGFTPVFVTAKPELYTPMYEDLQGIGSGEYKPLLTNTGATVTVVDKKGNKSKKFGTKPAQLKKHIEQMTLTGALPEGYDVLFTTYDQLKPAGNNKINPRHNLVRSIADNGGLFVLDESHKAAGKSGIGDIMKDVLERSGRAAYLSATYAKRPDSMPIYFLTDLSLAADSMEDMISAIEAGGVPLMEIASAQLTESGQFIRREMSWDGIEIPTWIDPDPERQKRDVAISDEVTERLRAIVAADRMFHTVGVDHLMDNLQEIGSSLLDNVSNFAEASVNHSNFTSVVHTAIAQMTLAIKADKAADMAIESLKNGEKPVIAINNTMGSFLDDYTEMHKVKKGDKLRGFDYRSVLGRMLRRTRRVTVVDEFGDKNPVEIPLEMLPIELQARYEATAKLIDDMNVDLTASPIDRMRQRIMEAGYTVKEITGRKDRVDYSTNPPTYETVDPKEQHDKIGTVAEFNSGEIDVAIINVAAAQGISMHAADKFDNDNPRRMIVAQAALDINDFMQILGRINRSGQTKLPLYTLFSTSLPAEKRPTAVTAGKMKKLNANTSSNENSATSVDAVDMLNKYGDEIIARFLDENPEYREFIHVDYNLTGDTPRVADVARNATGQLALLPDEMQRDFYDRVEPEYLGYIDYLNETGRNDLVARDIDLKARLMSERVLHEGKDQRNPFTANAMLGLYSVKKQGNPPKPDEVRKQLQKALPEQDFESMSGKTEAFTAFTDEMIAPAKKHVEEVMLPRLTEKVDEAFAKLSDKEKEQTNNASRIIAASQSKKADAYNHAFEMRQRQIDRMNETIDMLKGKFRIGNGVADFSVGSNMSPVSGVIVDVTHKWDDKSMGNPFAPSRFTVKIMLNSVIHQVTLPMSNMDRLFTTHARRPNLDHYFSSFQHSEEVTRESRYIVTGNLMRAYSELERHGDIVRFTKADGTIEQGILLPQGFNPEEDIKLDEKLASPEKAIQFLRDWSMDSEVQTYGIAARDGSIRAVPADRNGGITLIVEGSAKKGGRWWQNQALVTLIGRDFAGSRKTKTVEVTADKAGPVMSYIFADTPLYAAPSMANLTEGYTTRNGGNEHSPSTFFSRARSRNQEFDGTKSVPKAKRKVSGTKKADVQAVVDKTTRNWKDAPEVEVVQSIDELPQNVQDDINEANEGIENPEAIEGIFDASRTKVWIIADEIPSAKVAQRVIIHESVGHYGVRRVFGDDLRSVLRQVYLSQKPRIDEIANRYGLDLTIDEDRLIAAEEVLAHMAEEGKTQTLLSKAIAVIREWLRRMGFSFQFNDADLMRIIAQAKNATFNGKKAKVGGAVAMSRKADPYYSQMARVLEAKLPVSGPSQAMRVQINNLAKKGEFKTEELEWSGVNEWLDEQTGKLSRDDVVSFVNANRIQIEEVEKGKFNPVYTDETRMEAAEFFGFDHIIDNYTIEEQNKLVDKMNESNDRNLMAADRTKYSGYQIPGGENYRELLLTLPSDSLPAGYKVIENPSRARAAKNYIVVDSKGERYGSGDTRKEAIANYNGFHQDYKSGHWGESNVLAHIRFNERTDADGKRVLFIEEIQSDWHQQGRKIGYRRTVTPNEKAKIQNKLLQNERDRAAAYDAKDADKLRDLEQEARNLNRALYAGDSPIPDAPFKTTWPLLAMKRMIRHAAENGFDRIAWTTGEHQSERYDLSKQVDEIRAEILSDEKYAVHVYKYREGGRGLSDVLVSESGITIDRVEEIVGKDLAEKISKQGRKDEIYTGVDLKVGGEGMKGFYDQILPKAVNKYVKKWGAKTGQTEIIVDSAAVAADFEGNISDFDDLEPTTTVHSLDVTPDMRATVTEKGQTLFSRRHDQDDDQDPRIKSLLKKIGKGEQRPMIDRIKEFVGPGMKERLTYLKDMMIQGAFDQLKGLKRAEGNTAEYDRSAYVAARMATSTDSQLMVAMSKGPLRWIGNRATFVRGQKGLLDILQQVENKIELWEAYMVAKRAKRLQAEGKENLISPEEIEAGLALLEQHPEFERVAAEWAQFNKTMLDFAQDAGLINPESRKIWEHDDYIPFYRILDEEKASGPNGRRGLSHQTAGIRELKGGTANLNDILENMVMNTSHLLQAAMKNHALQMAVTNLQDSGTIRPAPHKFSKELIPMSQFKKILEEEGVDVDDLPEEVINGIRDMWALKTPTDKNVIRVMNDGKADFYYVDDPLLLRSLTSINQVAWGQWMSIFRAPKRWLTTMITADPAFQAANFVRDTLQAFVISRDNVKPLISGFKGAAKALSKDDEYWEMLAAGGGFHSGFINAHDPTAASRIIKAEMRHKDFQKTVIDSPVKLWDRWQEFGSAVENANRIAVYDGALKAGKTKLAAAYEAKDFMDFSMRGDYAIFNFLAQTVPFFNARLQGMYRLGRGIAENPTSFTTRGTLLVIASLALWALNKDDDRYRELQEWDKDTYWHFWVGGEHWRFPKPFEVGFIFGTMPERMFDAMYQDEDDPGKKIMERLLWNMHEVFNLGALPQTVGPIAEQIANRDFFRDAPIVGLHMEGLRPEAQYSPWTHETAIKLGQALGVSPARIDHLMQGYFGTIGDYALSATDILVRNVWDFPAEAAIRPEDFPVVKRFYRGDDPQSTRYASEYYDMLRELDKTFRTIKDYQKYGESDKAKALYEAEQKNLLPLPALHSAKKALSGIRQKTIFIHRTDTMTSDEKRAELNKLVEQKNEIYRKVMRQAKKVQRENGTD